jgi:crotonobetainyl-CoA:carnitine CoA-transferase CaiB-like acyl-CoA transferase
LTGIRVLELSTFFASPYANRFLRDLGAEVIKVEALDGDPMRSLPDPFEGVARGKRSVALDLKTLAGRAVVETLLGDADVLQHNFRPGAAERLGLDQASVRERHPPLIYDYAPGYGATGPKSRLQSFAPLLSGFVGIQVEAAGEGNLPTITFGNEDYYNGQLNAIGTLLALVHRDRTGAGQYVECPQLNSSVFVMSHWYRRAGTPHSALPALDHLQFGWSPYQRLYQCLDGYLCVCCTDAAQAAGRATAFTHHRAGRVSVIGQIVRLESARPREPVRAPLLGEHTIAVLTEAGLGDDAIADLLAGGTVYAPGRGTA